MLNFKEVKELPYKTEGFEEMLCSEVNKYYKGETRKNKKVWVLTSQRTGSAADRLAY
jgi:hypothetical protein